MTAFHLYRATSYCKNVPRTQLLWTQSLWETTGQSDYGYHVQLAPLLSVIMSGHWARPLGSSTEQCSLSTAKAAELFKWAIEDASETCNFDRSTLIASVIINWTAIRRIVHPNCLTRWVHSMSVFDGFTRWVHLLSSLVEFTVQLGSVDQQPLIAKQPIAKRLPTVLFLSLAFKRSVSSGQLSVIRPQPEG